MNNFIRLLLSSFLSFLFFANMKMYLEFDVIRVFLSLFLVLLVSGCAAPNKFSSHKYSPGTEYSYVSLMVNDGYVRQSLNCGQFGCTTYVDQTHLFVLDAFRATDKFQRVEINNGLARYKVIVGFERQEKGSEVVSFGKMMLGALTLFLLPMPYEYNYEGRFSIMDGGDILEDYRYRRESEELKFLFVDEQSTKKHAIASMVDNFLQDLERTGLLDDTLVLWTTEFGRMPSSQGGKGRDHNPHCFTNWMAGGGIKGGVTIGPSDEFGFKPADRSHFTQGYDIHATVLHLLGLDHEKLTYRYAGRDFRLTDVHGHVIKELLA